MTRARLSALGIAAEEKVFNRRLADTVAFVAPKQAREEAAGTTVAPAAGAAAGAGQTSEPSGMQTLFNALGRLLPDDSQRSTQRFQK